MTYDKHTACAFVGGEQAIPLCKASAAKPNHLEEGLLGTVVSGLKSWLDRYAQAAPEARRYRCAVGLCHSRGVSVRRIELVIMEVDF
jgi:hypothetical protein